MCLGIYRFAVAMNKKGKALEWYVELECLPGREIARSGRNADVVGDVVLCFFEITFGSLAIRV
jgi:hypothetical protein